MDLSTIGSISHFTKTPALKTQWNLKMKSGNVTGHSKGLDDFLSVGSSPSQAEQEAENEKMGKITAKVNAGAKLTEKEMEYLKEKNPQLYEKLRQIEKEQKAYEEALRHCKSKDEVQSLHMARVSESMQAAKNGDGTAAYRMNRMTESLNAFAETEEYKKLSTEAEQALERKEQRESEQVEEEQEPKAAEEKKAEQAEKEKSAPEQDAKAADVDVPAEEAPAKAEKPVESAESEAAVERPAVTPHFGTKAYVSQQEAEEQMEKRRKAIDVDA